MELAKVGLEKKLMKRLKMLINWTLLQMQKSDTIS